MSPAKVAAYSVHVLTASGIAFLFLAAAEISREATRPTWVFIWFLAATFVDAIDGPLARRFGTKTHAHSIDGRTIDDIVDFIGFTFLPLVLIWDMAWLPGHGIGGGVVVAAMMASLLGFAHRHAKDEAAGFFRGFPSYWNLIALYTGLVVALLPGAGPWINAALLLVLAVLTVLPVWFVYPNLAPPPWKPLVLWGSYAWALLLVAMLPFYPDRVPAWLTLISLIYPIFYIAISIYLRDRWPKRAEAPR